MARKIQDLYILLAPESKTFKSVSTKEALKGPYKPDSDNFELQIIVLAWLTGIY